MARPSRWRGRRFRGDRGRGHQKTLLYAVEPTDAAAYAAVCGVLVLSAAAGCWLLARRATTVDPAAGLREE